jgi:hypothetical protein
LSFDILDLDFLDLNILDLGKKRGAKVSARYNLRSGRSVNNFFASYAQPDNKGIGTQLHGRTLRS